MKAIVAASAALTAFGLGATASDAAVVTPPSCLNGPVLDLTKGCTATRGDGVYQNAGGGDSESAVERALLEALGTGVDISLYGKSDGNAGLFAITGSNSTAGTWDVLNNSVRIAYVTVKAADGFALYQWNANSGDFSTAGLVNNGGRQAAMSHLSFWTTSAIAAVPEPAAWATMIAGFALVGGTVRRRGGSRVLA